MLLKKIKKEIKIFLLCFLFVSFISTYYYTYKANAIGSSISEKVIRFHVKANSNSKEDQELKIKVKNNILFFLKNDLEKSKSLEETNQILKNNIPHIQYIARQTILNEGYDYNINIYFSNEYFPTKQYSNIFLPYGQYDTLRIDIGNYEGDNWWCILYPPLCYDQDKFISKKNNDILKKDFNEDEYNILNKNNKVKFKVVEIVKKIKKNKDN